MLISNGNVESRCLQASLLIAKCRPKFPEDLASQTCALEKWMKVSAMNGDLRDVWIWTMTLFVHIYIHIYIYINKQVDSSYLLLVLNHPKTIGFLKVADNWFSVI